MFELLVLGAVAAFLITRLFQVLGQRSGTENPEIAQAFSQRLMEGTPEDASPAPEVPEPVLEKKLDALVQEIKHLDPSFRVDWFIEGATRAFEMLLDAFSKGQKEILKKLMSPEIYGSFEQEIDKRLAKNQTLHTTLVKLDPPAIEKITLKGSIASITVSFTSEQINILKSQDGEILEGSPQQIEEVKDLWIFQRDVKQDTLNWYVVEI